jgi:hypothetical protein
MNQLVLVSNYFTKVEDFTYHGSVISNDNGAKKDIQARLSKARTAFHRLQPIWKARNFSINTKLKLSNSHALWVGMLENNTKRLTESRSIP